MIEATKLSGELFGPLTVGMLIRAYRTRNDLTQQQLAKMLDVTKSYVSDLENDRKEISLKKVRDIATVLEDSVNLFVKVKIEQDLRDAGLGKLLMVVPLEAEVVVGKRSKATTKKATRKVANKRH